MSASAMRLSGTLHDLLRPAGSSPLDRRRLPGPLETPSGSDLLAMLRRNVHPRRIVRGFNDLYWRACSCPEMNRQYRIDLLPSANSGSQVDDQVLGLDAWNAYLGALLTMPGIYRRRSHHGEIACGLRLAMELDRRRQTTADTCLQLLRWTTHPNSRPWLQSSRHFSNTPIGQEKGCDGSSSDNSRSGKRGEMSDFERHVAFAERAFCLALSLAHDHRHQRSTSQGSDGRPNQPGIHSANDLRMTLRDAWGYHCKVALMYEHPAERRECLLRMQKHCPQVLQDAQWTTDLLVTALNVDAVACVLPVVPPTTVLLGRHLQELWAQPQLLKATASSQLLLQYLQDEYDLFQFSSHRRPQEPNKHDDGGNSADGDHLNRGTTASNRRTTRAPSPVWDATSAVRLLHWSASRLRHIYADPGEHGAKHHGWDEDGNLRSILEWARHAYGMLQGSRATRPYAALWHECQSLYQGLLNRCPKK
jgi:hypothetical protein